MSNTQLRNKRTRVTLVIDQLNDGFEAWFENYHPGITGKGPLVKKAVGNLLEELRGHDYHITDRFFYEELYEQLETYD